MSRKFSHLAVVPLPRRSSAAAAASEVPAPQTPVPFLGFLSLAVVVLSLAVVVLSLAIVVFSLTVVPRPHAGKA